MKFRTLFVLSGLCGLLWACDAEAPTSGGGNSGNGGGAGTFGNTQAGTSGDFGSGNNGGAATNGGGAGTGDVIVDGSCTATGAEAEVGKQGADIVWAIDNSCSMATEAAAVQDNMNRFAKSLSDKGIDVRLVLISSESAGAMPMPCPDGDLVCIFNQVAAGINYGVCIDAPFGSGMCPKDSKAPNYLHVPNVVGSWDALVQIINSYPMYKDTLRAESKKHFVVVTDDESTQMTAAMFTSSANALDPTVIKDWGFHGIYAKTACPAAAAVGTVYDTLVKQANGVAGDLCLQEFDPVFDELAKNVETMAEIACDWAIPPAPTGQSLDPEKVNVRLTRPDATTVDLKKIPKDEDCADREGWYYDDYDKPTKVISCPTSCDGFRKNGGKVDVLFGCASVVVE